jgi:hypothetical protein
VGFVPRLGSSMHIGYKTPMLGKARAEPRRTPRIHLAIRLYSMFTPSSSLVVTPQSICADQRPASNSQHGNHALSIAATASALCYVPTSFSPMCHTRRNANDPFRMPSNWRHVLLVVLQIVSCEQKRGICSGGATVVARWWFSWYYLL